MISDISLRRVIWADAGKKKTDNTLMELQNAKVSSADDVLFTNVFVFNGEMI